LACHYSHICTRGGRWPKSSGDLPVESLLARFVEPGAALALLVAVAFVGSLIGAVGAWFGIFAAAKRITESWSPSLTPMLGSRPGEIVRLISELSSLALRDTQTALEGLRPEVGAVSGSSSSSVEESHTSTSSQPTESRTSSSLDGGTKSSEAATLLTNGQERASKRSKPAEAAPSPTQKNTPRSKNKSNCRPCRALRAFFWPADGSV